jgi:hypothetical protein
VADLTEIPEALHGLALRVPEDIREHLSATELRLRCTYASQLLAKADEADNETRRRSLRRRAERVLNAMSPDAFHLACRMLNDEMSKARLNGDDRAAMAAYRQLHDMERRHIYPPPEMQVAAFEAAVTRHLRTPGPPQKNLWTRRNERRRGR